MCRGVVVDHPLEKRFRRGVPEDGASGGLGHRFHDLVEDGRDPTASLDDADQLSLVVGNGKLPEGSRMSPQDDHKVAGPDVDHFPPHESGTGKDDHVVEVVG